MATPTPRVVINSIGLLSERRAEAVKRVLIEQFKLSASTLIAVGYGRTQLKIGTDPLAVKLPGADRQYRAAGGGGPVKPEATGSSCGRHP